MVLSSDEKSANVHCIHDMISAVTMGVALQELMISCTSELLQLQYCRCAALYHLET